MSDAPDALPATLAESHALLCQVRTELQQAKAALQRRDLEVEHLTLQLAKLRKLKFGRSGETLAALQQLTLWCTAQDIDVAASTVPGVDSAKPAPIKPARKPLPPHLPREDVRVPTSCRCPHCGGALRRIGDDVAETLEYIPARFKVIRTLRAKQACDACNRLVQSPATAGPVERGLAGPGLFAQILVSKYADHLPLYRQAQIFAREGVEQNPSTLGDWVAQTGKLLTPLAAVLRRHVLGGGVLHADDTPLPVLAPGTGKTKTGRFWTCVRDESPQGSSVPATVWFAYSPNRKGEHPNAHLNGYAGILHADGYAGFNRLYANGNIVEAACWAHARRKFTDVVQTTQSPTAIEAVRRIVRLYGIEKRIRGRPPDERRRIRQLESAPVLAGLKAWLADRLQEIPGISTLAQAMGYTLSRWQALTRFANNGRTEIDNNAAECALRTVALGRKNYLFAGSDAAAEGAAAIYSLIGTARMHGLNPRTYLTQVLACIADHPINRVDGLMPWAIAGRESMAEPLRGLG